MEQEASIETTTEEVSPTLEVAYSNSTSPTTLSAASAAKAPVQQTHTKSFINMKIFTSQTSLHSHDQCILNKSELKASRMVHIYSSTCFFLSLQESKIKMMKLSEVTQDEETRILKGGYVRFIDVIVGCDKFNKYYFDIKLSSNQRLNQERDLLQSTYVNIGEDSLSKMKIQSRDVVKFGREIYLVSLVEDRMGSDFHWFRDVKEQDLGGQGACRICLSSESEEDDCIIAPCFCKGSCGLIHLQCLRKWLEYRMIVSHNPKVTAYNLNVFNCQICKTSLPKYMKIKETVHELFPFSLETSKFLLLEKFSKKDMIAYIAPLKEEGEVELSVGRTDGSDINLCDSSISRKHGSLRVTEQGSIEIRDNKSKYGTFVELQRDLHDLTNLVLAKDRFIFYLNVQKQENQ